MNRKPWPILALALFQWISPLGDWLTSSLASHLSPIRYLMLAVSEEGLFSYFFHSWVPGLLAGIAVYRVKPWSPLLFLGCLLYGSYRSGISALQSFGPHPHEWLAHAGGVTLWVLPLLFNLLLGAWLLLPDVRRPFLNRSLRWWESPPRFAMNLPVRIFPVLGGKKGARVKMSNLSRGGALLEFRSSPPLERGDLLLIGFHATLSQSAHASPETWVFSEARVVHRAGGPEARSIGVEFCGMSPRSRKSLLKLLGACREWNIHPLRDKTGLWTDLQYWVNRLQGARKKGATAAPIPAALASVTSLTETPRRAA
jgi:hypothetical protein